MFFFIRFLQHFSGVELKTEIVTVPFIYKNSSKLNFENITTLNNTACRLQTAQNVSSLEHLDQGATSFRNMLQYC